MGQLQNVLSGVRWTDAAVIAAVIGGVFALTKEGLSFVFQLLEEKRQRKRIRQSLYARVWHDYFQMGMGAWKALLAWQMFYDDPIIAQAATEPPDTGFLFLHDKQLAVDVLQLADESPEIVASYLHAVTLRDRAGAVACDEKQEFDLLRYSYPRTRNVLHSLLDHASKSLGELANQFPKKRWWSRKRGLRELCEMNSGNLAKEMEKFPKVARDEALKASAEARQRLQQIKRPTGQGQLDEGDSSFPSHLTE
jgi:hypothetical protein